MAKGELSGEAAHCRHYERSEAIQEGSLDGSWIASLRSQ
jgi:hypothetical protein